MKDILYEIVDHKRVEVEQQKKVLPANLLYSIVEPLTEHSLPSMRQAITTAEVGIIAEFKRKSPSKGWIKEDGQADAIPLGYQQNGAAALSILTDSHYFGGDDRFIQAARASGVTIPILYKNFIVDEYQLFQARRVGASAVLLIAAVLSKEECRMLMRTAHELGMEVLLEMHNENDLDYADYEPDMYGINNRDLGTFVTEVSHSFRLASPLPEGVCKVSESGISTPDTVKALLDAGFKGFLIGEHFMRQPVPGYALKQFIDALKR